MPDVVDAHGTRAAGGHAGTGGGVADHGRGAPQAIAAAGDALPAARVVRHADVDASTLQRATVVVVGPVHVQVADAAVLVGVAGFEFGVVTVIKQRRVGSDILVPAAVQIVGHQTGVIEVRQGRHVFFATQYPGRGRTGNGQHVVLVVCHGGRIQF